MRCHPSAHELLLFVPRDRAMALRRRMLADPNFRDVNVSRLYRVGTGWAVTVCAECRNNTGRRHPERRTRAMHTA